MPASVYSHTQVLQRMCCFFVKHFQAQTTWAFSITLLWYAILTAVLVFYIIRLIQNLNILFIYFFTLKFIHLTHCATDSLKASSFALIWRWCWSHHPPPHPSPCRCLTTWLCLLSQKLQVVTPRYQKCILMMLPVSNVVLGKCNSIDELTLFAVIR